MHFIFQVNYATNIFQELPMLHDTWTPYTINQKHFRVNGVEKNFDQQEVGICI